MEPTAQDCHAVCSLWSTLSRAAVWCRFPHEKLANLLDETGFKATIYLQENLGLDLAKSGLPKGLKP